MEKPREVPHDLTTDNLSADDRVPFLRRKWVWHTKPVPRLGRSLSYGGTGKALKPVECLAKLRSANEAILEKQRPRMRKSCTLPVIAQEHSGSEQSLDNLETALSENTFGNKTKKVREWPVMKTINNESVKTNNDHLEITERDYTLEQGRKQTTKAISKRADCAKNIRSFVAYKSSQNSKDDSFENISKLSTFSESNHLNQIEEILSSKKSSFGAHER